MLGYLGLPATLRIQLSMDEERVAVSPPPHEVFDIELPLTSLHGVVCGQGKPLLIVPATISLVEDWLPLIQYMGQEYRAYFFELPGHGRSTAFEDGFSSELVSETIGHLLDELGLDEIALMGFSFGGILAMKTLQAIGDRVERVILLAPCVSYRGLLHTKPKILALRAAMETLKGRRARNGALKFMHDPRSVDAMVWFMTQVGKYETSADLRARLLEFPAETLDVLVSQVREILSITEEDLAGPYPQRCFFAMSVRDPLLDFSTSEAFALSQFSSTEVHRFDFDYHAPPEPFAFEELNRDYRPLLDEAFAD